MKETTKETMTTKAKNTVIDPVEQIAEVTTPDGKNAAAVALGRKGGLATSTRKTKAVTANAVKATIARKRNARARRKTAEKAERIEREKAERKAQI